MPMSRSGDGAFVTAVDAKRPIDSLPAKNPAELDAKNDNKFMKIQRARDKANTICHSLPLSIYSAVGFALGAAGGRE